MNLRNIFIIALLLAAVTACDSQADGNASGKQGKITIVTTPAGATVRIPALNKQIEAPCDISCPPGNYQILVEKEGFCPQRFLQKVSANKTVKKEIALEPFANMLLLTSSEDKTDVTINGKHHGATPLIVPGLTAGRYEIVFEKIGFKPEITDVVIPPASDRPQRITVSMKSDSGTFSIHTVPEGVSLFIDGKFVGKTPSGQISVREGEHKLELKCKGFNPEERPLRIVADRHVTVDPVTLTALPGYLTIKQVPENATVELDGQRLSDPGAKRELMPGTYKVKVSLNGYDTEERNVQITSENTTAETIELTRNTGEVTFLVTPPGVSIALNGKKIGMSQPKGDSRNESEPFRITGLPMGTHKLTFSHPKADKPVTKTFRIATKGESKMLPAVDLWVPNAHVTLAGKKEAIMNVRILELSPDSDYVTYQQTKGISETKKRSELQIQYLEQEKDPAYSTSHADIQPAN